MEDRKELALATILDPRFKDKFFGGNIIKATTKEWLLEEMTNVTVEAEPQLESAGPKRMCPLKNPVLLDVFMEIIADSSGQDAPSSTTSEIDKYFDDPLIDYKTGNLYNRWAQHHKEFPTLSS